MNDSAEAKHEPAAQREFITANCTPLENRFENRDVVGNRRGSPEFRGMNVKRIVANIATPNGNLAAQFYRDILGLELQMDHGWIRTFASDATMNVQVSIAAEGGSGTPVPDLSIEVDDINAALARMRAAGIAIEYGPINEPWGVRRFYVRDPFGKLINILAHV